MRFRQLALFAASLAVSSPVLPAVPNVGDTAKGNRFDLDNGQKLAVEDLKGMVVVVTFWSEDCKACDDQLKLMDYFVRNSGNVGLVALAAPVDASAPAAIRGAARGMKVHPVRKVTGWLGPMDAAPTTYVIDRHGKVRFAGTGVMTVTSLNDVLMPVIREPQPPM